MSYNRINVGVVNHDKTVSLPKTLGSSLTVAWSPVDNCGNPLDKYDTFDAVVVNTSRPLTGSPPTIPTSKKSFYFNLHRLKRHEGAVHFAYLLHRNESINFRAYDFMGETYLPTEHGDFQFFGFRHRIGPEQIIGVRTLPLPENPLVRIHSMCRTGDIFHSLKCDCREELANALSLVGRRGGMVIYAEEEGRGIGIFNKIKVYQSQQQGLDTVEAQFADDFPNDLRGYDYLRDVFRHFDVRRIQLITNNPQKRDVCFEAGVFVEKMVRLPSTATKHNEHYLKTKNSKNGHRIRLAYTNDRQKS